MSETWPFRWGSRTYIMGVLNATPDSFSGDGLQGTTVSAGERAREVAGAGADLLDIGGESTRPGYQPISASTELARVIPALEAVSSAIDLPVSIDTRKAEVARQAIEAGVSVVNDVSGLSDPEMAGAVAECGSGLIIVHNGRSETDEDVLEAVIRGLSGMAESAVRAGIHESKIAVDPGFGFGKVRRQNLEIMRRLAELHVLGFPVVIGPSRKATISRVLGVDVSERLEGTAALVSIGIANGADIVRVHDVHFVREVARMTDALAR